MVTRHCRRRHYRLLRSPRKLVTLTQNSNQQVPDATSFFPLVGCLPQAVWRLKDFLRKVRTLWHCSRLRSVALYLWLIGDIRQAIDRCSNIWASLPWLVMVSSSIRPTAWLQNSKKRAERSGEIDVRVIVTAIISALVICIIVCLSWAVNYRDNAITVPSATKMPENWSWRTRQLLTCRCVSVMLLRSMQNTRRS